MSKRLILILALAFVVGITAYAYAEVQNVKVGGQIYIQGVARQNFELDKTNDDKSGVMSTTKVDINADLTDNVAVRVMLADERDWGSPTGGVSSSFGVWLSYITLKEFLYSPLTLTIGKQVFQFGNGFVLANPDTNLANVATAFTDLSQAKAFEGIKAVLDYDPLTLTLLTAKLNERDIDITDDRDLYGVNAAYDFGNCLAEAYFVGEVSGTDDTATPKDKVYVLGVRGAGDVNDNLNLQGEIAIQTGDYYSALGATAVDREALGLQAMGTYKFNTTYSPALTLGYTYLSGDKDPSTGDYEAWDPMHEGQTPASILNALVAASNCHVINVKGSMKPTDDITLSLNYAHVRLDKNLTNATGYPDVNLGGVTATMTEKKKVGDEVDLEMVYNYTEDVQLSLLGGLFFPGNAFDNVNDKTASQLIGSMKVTF